MKDSPLAHAFASGMMALALGGCLAPTPDRSGISADEEAAKKTTFSIKGGEVVSAPGVVDIVGDVVTGCTGTMIGPNLVLTAAHCFRLGGAGTGTLTGTSNFIINHYDYGGRRKVYEGAATWHAYPGYYQVPDGSPFEDYPPSAQHDIGLIVFPKDLRETYYGDYKRIYRDGPSALERGSIHVYGAGIYTASGSDDLNLRTAEYPVEAVTEKFILVDNSSESGICHGDSGGPAMEVVSVGTGFWGMQTVAGVATLMDQIPGSGTWCAGDDGRILLPQWQDWDDAWYTRIDDAKMSWIESILGTTCATSTSASSARYARCFSVPFMANIDGETLSFGAAIAIATML